MIQFHKIQSNNIIQEEIVNFTITLFHFSNLF